MHTSTFLSLLPSHIDLKTNRLVIPIKDDRPFGLRSIELVFEFRFRCEDAAEFCDFVTGVRKAVDVNLLDLLIASNRDFELVLRVRSWFVSICVNNEWVCRMACLIQGS